MLGKLKVLLPQRVLLIFIVIVYWAVASIALTSCTARENLSQSTAETNWATQSQRSITLAENFKIAMGQTIYVPIYSHIYHQDDRRALDLATTLSIRNSDLERAIVITSIRYYDGNGKLVRQYLKSPIELAALASTDFFVNASDRSGGLGAKFIVEWVAQTTVSEPIIEAIAIGSSSQQGISFVSPGKVIKSINNPQPSAVSQSSSSAK
jgi:hypothetical protein